jgi:bacterioferritin-associated ferredoxin
MACQGQSGKAIREAIKEGITALRFENSKL